MTLMFTEAHRIMGRYSLFSRSVEKLHEATQIFVMVDYVREMIVKKSSMANMDCLSICSSFWIKEDGFVCCFVCFFFPFNFWYAFILSFCQLLFLFPCFSLFICVLQRNPFNITHMHMHTRTHTH